jgi:pyruvate formate lyase activating enzyme
MKKERDIRDIKIALRKTSLVDYPGKVAAALFFCGCNLRCPWCYNWELVTSPPDDLTGLDEALELVRKRKRLLGGVVLSGGEPTLLEELPLIIAEIKRMGLPVKLDTNGMLPDVLKNLCKNGDTRPDFIAMDIKLPPERYIELTGRKDNAGPDTMRETAQEAAAPDDIRAAEIANKIRESIAFIRESGIEHEFRALLLPAPYFSPKDARIIESVADGTLKVRAFQGGNCLDKTWNQYTSTHVS